MCGIAGIAWSERGLAADPATVRGMADALAHRGPDDEGVYHSAWGFVDRAEEARRAGAAPETAAVPNPHVGACLGHRRLSIIDLGGGRQPLSNEDGTVWITFNGEIYNYKELVAELTRRGHRFRTQTDTEAIVHLYEERGADCVLELRGMFAFALWDERRQRLVLARDRLGKKPFVYRQEPGRLLFASELKALLQVPGLPRKLSPRAVDEFLTYQYVPHPHSILEGFAKLPPATVGVYERGQLALSRYWTPRFDEQRPQPAADADLRSRRRADLRRLLTEAVQLRMRSDVPVGAFLSGGVDSTITAGLMQRLSPRPIKTFSIGFPIPEFDESAYAREAARSLGTEHHEAVVEPSALEKLPQLTWHYDEPFADSSAIPMLYLSEMTRREVKVVLSGDGGDELFCGYRRYAAIWLAQRFHWIPHAVRRVAAAAAARIPVPQSQHSRLRQLQRLVTTLGEPVPLQYLKLVGIFDARLRKQLYTADFARVLDGADSSEFLRQAYDRFPRLDLVSKVSCADLLTYLPCDILTKVDIATMAYGLEARCPLLDHEVVDFAAGLPVGEKFRRGKGKRILRETFADLLPPRIEARRKMGFGVPLRHWFRSELKPLLHDVLLDGRTRARGLFEAKTVDRLVREHESGSWDHSHRLWALLVLELWQRRFLDADPRAPAGGTPF